MLDPVRAMVRLLRFDAQSPCASQEHFVQAPIISMIVDVYSTQPDSTGNRLPSLLERKSPLASESVVILHHAILPMLGRLRLVRRVGSPTAVIALQS